MAQETTSLQGSHININSGGSKIRAEIKNAMEKHELQAYYQPQFDAVTGKLISAEALVRWIKEDGSIIPPGDFIPQMEQDEQVNAIDWYMAREACQTLVRQKSTQGKALPIAVNFSRWHVKEKDFIQRLNSLMDEHGLKHSLLTVEITESALIEEEGNILAWIESIRENGFKVAIDDFGSGLSSLQFVKDMPVDILKIDKSLLSKNCEQEKERIVLESIFYFAHRLKMETVAEGVETREQLGFLRTCSCKKIQGFIFARPMQEKDYLELCLRDEGIDDGADILEIQTTASAMQLLTDAIFMKYPLVIFANLTRNSFYMMAYENFSATTCPSTGVFDELIGHGAATMHPEDQEAFANTFGRENLIREYEAGKKSVRLVSRQIGDDGIYRTVETTDYFVKNPSSDDILVISLSENRE